MVTRRLQQAQVWHPPQRPVLTGGYNLPLDVLAVLQRCIGLGRWEISCHLQHVLIHIGQLFGSLHGGQCGE